MSKSKLNMFGPPISSDQTPVSELGLTPKNQKIIEIINSQKEGPLADIEFNTAADIINTYPTRYESVRHWTSNADVKERLQKLLLTKEPIQVVAPVNIYHNEKEYEDREPYPYTSGTIKTHYLTDPDRQKPPTKIFCWGKHLDMELGKLYAISGCATKNTYNDDVSYQLKLGKDSLVTEVDSVDAGPTSKWVVRASYELPRKVKIDYNGRLMPLKQLLAHSIVARTPKLLEIINNEPDPIPTDIIDKHPEIVPLNVLAKMIHGVPDNSWRDIAQHKARSAIAFRHMVTYNAGRYRSQGRVMVPSTPFFAKEIKAAMDGLPFKLTNGKDGQMAFLKKIFKDLHNRGQKRPLLDAVLQAETGAGKTIVTFILALNNALAGHQTAIMVPSTVLADQHYKNALEFFTNNGFKPGQIGLLTSKTPQKSDVIKNIANGSIKIVIGSQSLTGDKVKYHDLGLWILDEEHLLGVAQKEKATRKIAGKPIDLLRTTATPIPRTKQLADVKLSRWYHIGDMPEGWKRVPTEHHALDDVYDDDSGEPSDWSSVLEDWLIPKLEEIKPTNKNQVFIVTPAIDSKHKDLNGSSIKNVVEMVDKHYSGKYGVIHGRVKDDESRQVMDDFKAGKLAIMIATTKIGVGVDVEHANTMIAVGAQRFGNAQLHQLRGRVGRSAKSTNPKTYFVTRGDKEIVTQIAKANTAEMVANIDHDQRGFGELYGLKQSGKPDESKDFWGFLADDPFKYQSLANQIAEAVADAK